MKSYIPYSPKMAIDAYILAKQGMSNSKITKVFRTKSFGTWIKKYPELAYALEKARNGGKGREDVPTFRDYVYKQLPADLQALWDKIDLWQDHPLAHERIEAILARESTRVRQHLWMHAMVYTNFNQSESCRRVNISKSTMFAWIDDDPGFAELLDEIIWHKKNYFENGLLGLVGEGNVNAIIFANRTQNRDRGYSDKLSVEHSGEVNVNVGITLSVDQLGLPLEVRKLILEKMRTLVPVAPRLPAPLKRMEKEEAFILENKEEAAR